MAHASRLHFWCRLVASLRLGSASLLARLASARLPACSAWLGSPPAFRPSGLLARSVASARPSLIDTIHLRRPFVSSLGGCSLGGFAFAFVPCPSWPLFSPLLASNSKVIPSYLQGLEGPENGLFLALSLSIQEARFWPPLQSLLRQGRPCLPATYKDR